MDTPDRSSSFDLQLELRHDVLASDLASDSEDVDITEEVEKKTEVDAHGPVQSNTR